ncbi:MAG: hypothetical protein R2776_01075 [Flavobacteriaceae bacterium]|nr:hypothetical protein [Flavobacteriaceae bacterium]
MNLLRNIITDTVFLEKLIPQSAPFVMVDELLYFSEEKVVSGLTVNNTNLFTYQNKFTAPGIVEHMAQTVALYTGYQYFLKGEPAPIGYIGAIKKVEINTLPNVSNKLVTTATILHEFMDVTLVSIETQCNSVTIAMSEMKTVLAKK